MSPYAFDLVPYYKLMLVHPPFAAHVDEWQPVSVSLVDAPFLIFAFAATALFARQARSLHSLERLALPMLLVAALLAGRNSIWLGLAGIISLAALLDLEWRPIGNKASGLQRVDRGLAVAALAAAAAVAVVTFSRPDSWFEQRWPAEAAAIVAAQTQADPTLRVFPDDAHSAWLTWKQPTLVGKVAYDVRFELLTRAQLQRLGTFRQNLGGKWRDAVSGYRLMTFSHLPVDGAAEHRALADGGQVLYAGNGIDIVKRP